MTDFKMVANRQVKDKEQDGGVAMEATLSVVAADISLIAAEESERQERQEENKATKDKDLAVQLEIAMEEIGRLKSLMTMLLKKASIKEAEIQESSRDIANSVARSPLPDQWVGHRSANGLAFGHVQRFDRPKARLTRHRRRPHYRSGSRHNSRPPKTPRHARQ